MLSVHDESEANTEFAMFQAHDVRSENNGYELAVYWNKPHPSSGPYISLNYLQCVNAEGFGITRADLSEGLSELPMAFIGFEVQVVYRSGREELMAIRLSLQVTPQPALHLGDGGLRTFILLR